MGFFDVHRERVLLHFNPLVRARGPSSNLFHHGAGYDPLAQVLRADRNRIVREDSVPRLVQGVQGDGGAVLRASLWIVVDIL